MNYIDIFVCSVPTANRELYLEHAKATTAIFKAHGALKVLECWGDDVPDVKLTSLPMAVKREADETVVLSSSRASRSCLRPALHAKARPPKKTPQFRPPRASRPSAAR